MRTLNAGLFISVDGVVEAPETWQLPYLDEQLGRTVGAKMAANDALLLGRRTYQGFAEHFGGRSGDPQADAMNATRKYVVSRTLTSADWANSVLLGADWVERVRELKAGPGAGIGVSGSITLVRALLEHGLLDQLHLTVHPVVLGKGERLFPDGAPTTSLRLLRADVLDSGVLDTVYAPVTS